MQSSKQFEVMERIDGTPEWGVYPVGQFDFWLASLKRKEHAERLCDLLNDINIVNQDGDYKAQTDETNFRIAQTTKLFCLQENLTWVDLGMADNHVRIINAVLESRAK